MTRSPLARDAGRFGAEPGSGRPEAL